MASTTVYEIRTDSITLKVPNRNHMIVRRFLDENVDDSAAFMGENAEAIEEYATEAEALEALKAHHATAGAGWGVRCYEVDVISYWIIPVEYELDEDGERDYCYYEDHAPIAFAPFRDDISLYFGMYPIFDWNGKEWVRRIEDWEVDDEEDAEE